MFHGAGVRTGGGLNYGAHGNIPKCKLYHVEKEHSDTVVHVLYHVISSRGIRYIIFLQIIIVVSRQIMATLKIIRRHVSLSVEHTTTAVECVFSLFTLECSLDLIFGHEPLSGLIRVLRTHDRVCLRAAVQKRVDGCE